MTRPIHPTTPRPARKAMDRLPHPGLSLLLAAVWLLLQNSLALPQLITAALLGWAVPRLLGGFLADAPRPVASTGGATDWRQRLARLGTVARLCAVVLYDIVISNSRGPSLILAWMCGVRPL